MTVYRADLPVLAPPDTIPTPEAHDDLPGTGSDSSSQKIDDAHPQAGIDNSRLRTDEPGTGLSKFDRPQGVDSHEPIEVDFTDLNTFQGEFYLSSEDCRARNADDVDADLPMDPAEPRKQATTHINVTSDEVARTTGAQREQWLEAGRTEISNLTSKRSDEHKAGALEPINPSEKDRLKSRATIDG